MQHPSPGTKLNRRQFLGLTGAALAFPTLIASSALGREDRPAPSARINLGVVGCGSMGTGNTDAFLALKGCRVVAACDVDRNHQETLVRKGKIQKTAPPSAIEVARRGTGGYMFPTRQRRGG